LLAGIVPARKFMASLPAKPPLVPMVRYLSHDHVPHVIPEGLAIDRKELTTSFEP